MHVLVNVGVCVCVCVPGYWVALCACASVTRTSKPPLQPVATPPHSPYLASFHLFHAPFGTRCCNTWIDSKRFWPYVVRRNFPLGMPNGVRHCQQELGKGERGSSKGGGGRRGVSATGSRVGFGLVSVFRLGLSEMTSEVLLVLHTSTKCNTHTYTDREREREWKRGRERGRVGNRQHI